MEDEIERLNIPGPKAKYIVDQIGKRSRILLQDLVNLYEND